MIRPETPVAPLLTMCIRGTQKPTSPMYHPKTCWQNTHRNPAQTPKTVFGVTSGPLSTCLLNGFKVQTVKCAECVGLLRRAWGPPRETGLSRFLCLCGENTSSILCHNTLPSADPRGSCYLRFSGPVFTEADRDVLPRREVGQLASWPSDRYFVVSITGNCVFEKRRRLSRSLKESDLLKLQKINWCWSVAEVP